MYAQQHKPIERISSAARAPALDRSPRTARWRGGWPVWGGELGRTAMSQGDARAPLIKCFSSCWRAVAFKAASPSGQTEQLGCAAVENAVAVPDFHATNAAFAGYRSQAPDGEVPGPGCAVDRHRW